RDFHVTGVQTCALPISEGAAFRSADGGISFEPVTIGGQIIACHAASSDIVYALLENGLAKSTDGGSSWNALDAFVHGVEVSGTRSEERRVGKEGRGRGA